MRRGPQPRMLALDCAETLEGFPVELDAVAEAIRSDGEALLDPEGFGDEAVETEAVDLQVGAVGYRGEEMHGQVVGAVRGHRQVEGLGQMADLEEDGDAAAIGDVGLRKGD